MKRRENLTLDCPIQEPIDQERRSRIRSAYDAAVQTVGEREDRYVQDRLDRVLARLEAQGGWPLRLSLTAKALGEAYFMEASLEHRLSDPGRRYVLAALHYLCDPFDVMPDFTNAGYVDDALVLNRCLSMLRNRCQDVYQLLVEVT